MSTLPRYVNYPRLVHTEQLSSVNENYLNAMVNQAGFTCVIHRLTITSDITGPMVVQEFNTGGGATFGRAWVLAGTPLVIEGHVNAQGYSTFRVNRPLVGVAGEGLTGAYDSEVFITCEYSLVPDGQA